MSLHSAEENACFMHIIDNERLRQICLRLGAPDSYSNMNHLIAQSMLGFAAPLHSRPEGDAIGATMKRYHTSMAPMPRRHMISVSHAPLWLPGCEPIVPDPSSQSPVTKMTSVEELALEVLRSDNSLTNEGQRDEVVVCGVASFRSLRRRPGIVYRAKDVYFPMFEVTKEKETIDEEEEEIRFRLEADARSAFNDEEDEQESSDVLHKYKDLNIEDDLEGDETPPVEVEEDQKPIKIGRVPDPLRCSLSSGTPMSYDGVVNVQLPAVDSQGDEIYFDEDEDHGGEAHGSDEPARTEAECVSVTLFANSVALHQTFQRSLDQYRQVLGEQRHLEQPYLATRNDYEVKDSLVRLTELVEEYQSGY
jgi:hypothetical protein